MGRLRSTLRQSEDLVRLVRRLRTRLLKRKRRKHFERYLASTTMRKLQLGSGANHLPGWLNTDSDIGPTNNAYLNIIEAFPFPDKTFNYIFCEHTIEHISFNQAGVMLAECRRVLSPGGKIRLATPNLAVYVKLYAGGDEAIVNESTTEIFNSWILRGFYEAKNYRPLSDEPSALFVINDLFRNYEHKFIYDFGTLAELLKHTGFGNICECSAGVSLDENLNGLETHNDRINAFLTIVVEAQRLSVDPALVSS